MTYTLKCVTGPVPGDTHNTEYGGEGMDTNRFLDYASTEKNPDWENHIEREIPLYKRKNDIRSE